jgi:S1-C subfamily serine protease
MRTLTVLLTLALACALVTAQDLSPAQINEKYSQATVLIKTDIGAGSGFFVSPDGLIATAYHVIANARQLAVKTASGDIYDHVLLVASDERRDIAVLKIAGSDLHFVELENLDDVKVGEHVTVIGNLLGIEKLQSTVTDGVVSGVRDFDWGYKILQLSAPISPGNSGGPVFSSRGRVIGVAVFKLIGGENLNFAVPSNYVHGLLDIADKEHPISKWEGSSGGGVFTTPEPVSVISGRWKSECGQGGIFQVEDKKPFVRILNLTNGAATYDLKWEGDLIFGFAVSGRVMAWALFKPEDSEHLNVWAFKRKPDDDRKKELEFARNESEKKKPYCTWVKVSD